MLYFLRSVLLTVFILRYSFFNLFLLLCNAGGVCTRLQGVFERYITKKNT